MIIGHKIKKSFQGKTVLEDVSFRANSGEITALIGLNNAGKTTLIKMIAGILNVEEGYLRIDGLEPSDFRKNENNVIAFMSNSYTNLSGKETVGDVITECRKIYRVPKEFYDYFWDYAGKALDIEGLWTRECEKLSLGERLKVEFFYTLLMRPTLWIMDEPTVGVDYETRLKMYEILQHIKSRYREMTILIVTHNIQEMELLCDRILVLHGGQIIFSGPLEHLQQRYQAMGVINCEVAQGMVAFQDMPINWYEIDGNRVKLIYDKHYITAVTVLKYMLETAKLENISVTDIDMESMIKSIFQREN